MVSGDTQEGDTGKKSSLLGASLEEDLSALTTDIGKVQSDIHALRNAIDELRGAVAKVTGDETTRRGKHDTNKNEPTKAELREAKAAQRDYLVAASQVALSMIASPSVRKGPIQFLAFTPAATSLVAQRAQSTMRSITLPAALIGLAALVGPKLFK